MPTLLLEALSEEIPARMQRPAAAELERLAEKELERAELMPSELACHVTPRRLVLTARGLPSAQPDRVEERKGPRVGAPEAAVAGFLRSTGLTREQLEERELPKGTFYFAVVEQHGRPAAQVLPELLTSVLQRFGWPKSMRWGDHDVRWVRPVHSLLCLLDGAVLPVTLGHIEASRMSRGHRFLAPEAFAVDGLDDYLHRLAQAHVILDSHERSRRILEEARGLARATDAELIEDDALLEEVAGLVEEPVVFLGSIDEKYLELPPEVLTTVMRTHQKYFSLRPAGPVDGTTLAPHFIAVANTATRDGGQRVTAGNERVLRARLDDAAFFWHSDRQEPLVDRVPRLREIVFQGRFGAAADRMSHKVARMERLAAIIAHRIGGDVELSRRAARLGKADLVTEMVGEFPELQGRIGSYYAAHDSEDERVCRAIEEHYLPQGPSDSCPNGEVARAVALADKIDTLVGFFAIGERPTGSKDPYALRRAALGVLRIILEGSIRISLRELFAESRQAYPAELGELSTQDLSNQLLEFLADRIVVVLRDRGVRHDLISAVFAAEADDDLVRLVRKVESLQAFLDGEDGVNLLAAMRRASSIVRKEERRDGCAYDGEVDEALLREEPERELAAELTRASQAIGAALGREDFADAMERLAALRPTVDRFFDRVTVNADEPSLRANRLRLLTGVRRALSDVADFQLIEGSN